MALYWQWNSKIGSLELESKHDNKPYTVNIYQGNCLAVFITEFFDKIQKKDMYFVYSFFNDPAHARRILKDQQNGTLFGDKVISIKLNLYYEENYKLLKLFTKYGYTVECFNKEPEKKQENGQQ